MSDYSKIKVNDVVTDGEETFLVTRIDEGKYLSGIDKNGELYGGFRIEKCKRTGQTIDIEHLLEQIRGDE